MRYSWLPLSLLVAAFLAFVGTAVGASQSLAELLERDAQRSQALATQTELQRLLMLLIDIETGQRGFLITGQQPFLRPYEDALGPDGFLRYKYQGNPQHYTNRGLREAHTLEVPLIWFFGVQQGLYLPFYPVWIVADEPEQSQVAVALDESQTKLADHASLTPLERRYSERISRQRLHQPVFRQRVIRAYDTSCAMCRLRHASLLDAAHIIPDSDDRGLPAVSNGLSLCKIHHAAYDANILGIRPDLRIQVRTDILQEVDGPMLKHGLQEMNGLTLTLPRRRADRPNSEALEQRYEAFRNAG